MTGNQDEKKKSTLVVWQDNPCNKSGYGKVVVVNNQQEAIRLLSEDDSKVVYCSPNTPPYIRTVLNMVMVNG